jgi:hypothetical protein
MLVMTLNHFIVNIAKEFNLPCEIVDCKLFFILFNTENERLVAGAYLGIFFGRGVQNFYYI